MSILSRAAMFVSRSLFLYGCTELRLGTNIATAMHLVATFVLASRGAPYLALPFLAVVLCYVATRSYALIPYALLLASIPGVWFAVSRFIVDLALGMQCDPLSYASIYLVFVLGALNTLYVLHATNLSELCYVVTKLTKSRELGLAPYLLWRVASKIFKDVSEMLYAHRLKGVEVWKSLGMTFVWGEEVSKLFTEGLLLKAPLFRAKAIYSRRALALQSLVLLLDTVSILLSTR